MPSLPNQQGKYKKALITTVCIEWSTVHWSSKIALFREKKTTSVISNLLASVRIKPLRPSQEIVPPSSKKKKKKAQNNFINWEDSYKGHSSLSVFILHLHCMYPQFQGYFKCTLVMQEYLKANQDWDLITGLNIKHILSLPQRTYKPDRRKETPLLTSLWI